MEILPVVVSLVPLTEFDWLIITDITLLDHELDDQLVVHLVFDVVEYVATHVTFADPTEVDTVALCEPLYEAALTQVNVVAISPIVTTKLKQNCLSLFI